ncbi:MAG TPA: hydantoinase/oxoprolinase family protein [Dehalococcoidia bacterium]|nr:hydantoinase/oxoprolinase family protein [Dehalococcoidia bacterium]
MDFTIDIDTGGSFTDGFITAGDRVYQVKVDTTPHDLTVCFLNCIEEGAGQIGISAEELLSRTQVVRYSTTIGTNCLLQRNGPKLGLIATEGFTDTLYASHVSGESAEVLDSIASPGMRVGLKEEVTGSGKPIYPLSEGDVREAVEFLLDSGARSIVISLRNSAVNPSHEQKAKAIIDSEYPRHYLGSVRILTSSAVTAHPDNHIRTCSAVLNAYIHRDMVRYLYRADEALHQRGYRRPLLVVHSSGGAARVAKTTALNTYNSGPVAGLIGCSKIASELYKVKDFVSVDVGGTSVDIGVGLGGKLSAEREPAIEGVPIGLPMVTLGTAGGGGGSIARIDPAAKGVRVGPESAGALPGPVAYDLGGMEPTITDADLVLGYLDPDYFLGGRKRLAKDKAAAAINNLIASGLGLSVEEAAWKIIQTSEDDVSRQIKENIDRKGLKAGNLTLFAFGGGGGTRCCGYASRLGISRVIVFAFNAVASAFGASTMDILHTYERSPRATLRTASGSYPASELKSIGQSIAEMMESAKRDMRGEGFAPEDLTFKLEFGMRGKGGFQWIESPLVQMKNEAEANKLCKLYASRSGKDSGKLTVESITLQAECVTPHYQLPASPEQGPDPQKAKKGTRDVYWGKGFVKTDIYGHDRLRCGNRIEGPAIIESPDTTYVIPKGWTYTVDKYLNGIMEVSRT